MVSLVPESTKVGITILLKFWKLLLMSAVVVPSISSLLEIEGKRADWLDNRIMIPTIYVCFVLYCITLYLYGSCVYINLAIDKEDSLSSWTSLSPILPSSLSILVRISLDGCLYCIRQLSSY